MRIEDSEKRTDAEEARKDARDGAIASKSAIRLAAIAGIAADPFCNGTAAVRAMAVAREKKARGGGGA